MLNNAKFDTEIKSVTESTSNEDNINYSIKTKKDNNYIINAIGFNIGYLANEYRIGDKIDVAGVLEINTFNGVDNLQINIKDIMKSI